MLSFAIVCIIYLLEYLVLAQQKPRGRGVGRAHDYKTMGFPIFAFTPSLPTSLLQFTTTFSSTRPPTMNIVEPIPIEPPAISVTVSELEVEQLRVADVVNTLGDDIESLFHSKTFTNWAGNQSCKPEHIYYPKTLDNIKRYVLQAKSEGKNLRCVGSGHSWSSTAITDGFMLNMTKMEKVHDPVYSNEEKSWTVEVETGVLVSDLDDVLSKHNPPLALPSNVVLESVRRQPLSSLIIRSMSSVYRCNSALTTRCVTVVSLPSAV